MAPEVIKGTEFSQKSDVYSFGVILRELNVRKKLYEGFFYYLLRFQQFRSNRENGKRKQF
jgi:serine/threonine protein kinase